MSSTTTLNRQKRAVPQWSLDAALAGLPLALIVVGPAIVVGIGGKTLFVYASQIAIAVLVIHIGFSVLAQRSFGGVPATMRWLLAAVTLLAVPLIGATDPAAGVVAYLNFAAGTVGGVAIAQVWKGMPRDYSWIDVGYIVFLVGGVAQVLISFSRASSVNSLHQSAQTPWANSSVAGGALVVAGLIVMAQSARMGRYRMYAITVGLVAIGVALLTLTRGAIVAACVGAMFFLWSKSGRQRPRRLRPAVTASKRAGRSDLVQLLFRVLAVLIPVVAFMGVERATELRAQLNNRVYENVDVRLALYQLAWESFLRSPLTGTGWASFREVSVDTGKSETFAHNLVLSMLQIGGLLSVPYLVALAVVMYRAFRHGGPYTAAIAAALAISMTQPFFESTVCNLIVLPVALLAGLSTATAAEDDGGGIVTPRPGSARARLRPTRRMQPEWTS